MEKNLPLCPALSRRCFLKTTAAGVMSSGAFFGLTESLSAMAPAPDLSLKTKIRVGKVYLGHERPGWPMSKVDLAAEVGRYEKAMAGLAGLQDVEFVDGGLVGNAQQAAAALAKFQDVSGILVLHLTLGTGGLMQTLMDSKLPTMIFSMPYCGHEWHLLGSWQRQGRRVDAVCSSRFEDIAEAVRPFRALQRLRETRILHLSQNVADPKYVEAIRTKFGSEIISLKLPDLQRAYEQADRAEAEADARRWLKEARKTVEPSREEVIKGSLMYLAMRDLMAQHRAQAVTMNCLGMGLMDRGMGYPCLGFVRFNNQLLAGVCEADLKSTMTQLIFTYLVGRTGFVTDPMFDQSNSTIIHAHCVAATQMEGPGTKPAPYHIRTHLEDNRGVSLMVKMPVNRPLSMARLIGTDTMLFSTGQAVDSPMVERGCRSKLTMKVANFDRFLRQWSCGLHRVLFYGDHTRDIARFCGLTGVRLFLEDQDDLRNVPGLEWEAHVHA